MAHKTHALTDRLILPSLQAPEGRPGELRRRIVELEKLYKASLEEIAMLSGERDELVAAIKKWAMADKMERRELLFEAEIQDLRTALKQSRKQLALLEQELAGARGHQQRRLRA